RRRSGVPAVRRDVLLPNEVGYTLPLENLNKDATRGVEALITYSKNVGKLNFSVGVNGTFARNRLLFDYKQAFGNSYNEYRTSNQDRWAGYGASFIYKVIGRFQSQGEIDKYPVNIDGQGNRTLLPGDFIYEDFTPDGVINDLDRQPLAFARGENPLLQFGSTVNASYKGFSLALVFAGASMMSFERAVELKILFQNNGTSPHYALEDRWHREDPYDRNSAWVAGTYPAVRRGNSHINYQNNTFWTTNVTYLRLRNIELGYDIPKSLLQKVGAKKIRFYVNATNFITLDNVTKLEIDPEITSGGGLVYPQQKLINFGFNLSF
ncbi:MAG: SusC/RagA family TonB-linked outer membrane protein, partial [Chitinophagaceae bacterium]